MRLFDGKRLYLNKVINYFSNMKKFLLAILVLLSSTQSVFSEAEKENLMNKKILFVLTSHSKLGNTGKVTGFYLSEAAHPHKVLTDAGFEIDFVSPQGGKAPIDGFDLKDPINKAFIENKKYSEQIENTKKPSEINPKDYAAIFYVGGHGTMWDFPDNKELAEIASKIYENNGVVGAVCHGPVELVNIKLSNGDYLVKGKNVTSFTNEEEAAVGMTDEMPFLLETKLKELGANFSKTENFQANVAVSERLVTGQNPASATHVGEEIAKLLKN
jgi:putative intracellular protease/amidase